MLQLVRALLIWHGEKADALHRSDAENLFLAGDRVSVSVGETK